MVERKDRSGGAFNRQRRELLASFPAALIAGCAAPRDPDALSFWAQSTEGENAPRLLPPFAHATGIRVDVQALPSTAAHEKILTAYAGNALPDVIAIRSEWTAELAMLGMMAPVPPALQADQFASALDTVRVGGRVMALPWLVDSLVQYYRRDLLAAASYPAPPPDWAGWTRMGRVLKRRRPDDWVVLMLLDWPEHLFGFAAQQPEPLLRDRNTRGNFSSPGFRAALAHYKSLFDEGFAPRIVGAEMGDMGNAFGAGWVSIVPGIADFAGDIRNRSIPSAHWAVAEMPGPNGPAPGPVSGTSLMVTTAARTPERAWALVRFLCEPATQRRFHAMTGALPSRRQAWAAPEMRGDRAAQVFYGQLEHGVAPPAVPEWARIQVEVQLVAEHMVRGRFGVDEAAREMDARVDRLLAKRRWLLDRGLAA